MNSKRFMPQRDGTLSRRLLLKRLAVLGAAVFAPALLGVSGCQTMKGSFDEKDKQPKQSKTVDDVLREKRPSW